MMPSKLRELVGAARQGSPAEIGRRRDGDDVNRRQLARHDTRRQGEAAADGRIEAFADDVDLAVVEMPVGHDARIAGEKIGQQRHQEMAPERLAHADLQGAHGLFLGNLDAVHRRLQRRQGAVDLAQEPLAAFGQGEPARAAMKEAHAEIGFEARHVLADAGRRQAEHPRRGGKAALLGRLHERHQVLHVAPCPAS